MSKKQGPVKQALSPKTVLLNLFMGGDFLLLRRISKEICRSPESSEQDRNLAQSMLRITLPDAQALLAGAVCLALSVSVAFIVAY